VLLGCAGHAVAGKARLVERPDLGVTLIHFEGEIVRGDLERIQALVPAATKANPPNQVFVSLASPGGLTWLKIRNPAYERR
jgi:ClpP class serine protease